MQATLKDRIDRILSQGLKEGHTDLETLPNGRVGGYVISSDFQQLDFEDRRARIRKLLEQAVSEGQLQRAEITQVSTLLTYTPEEWSIATSDLATDN